MRTRSGIRRTLVACAIAAVVVGTTTTAAQEWKPQKTVEIVVSAGAGGAADRSSRLAQRHLQALPGMPSINVSNRAGGGGTIAWTYISQHPGDPHILGSLSPGIVTNEIVGASQLTWRDFTPLNLMLREYVAVTVLASMPFKSARDITTRLKKNPASITFGFAAALGNQNHVVIGMLARAAGADPKTLKLVVFNSGNLAATALLGGHIDVLVGTPGTILPHVSAGRARALGLSGPERQPGAYAATPTLREQGIDAVYYSWRGFLGAKGLTPAQIAFWEQAFGRLMQQEEWKADYVRNAWVEDFRGAAETRKHLEAESAFMRKTLLELGVIKK